jgi:hypothetical protein
MSDFVKAAKILGACVLVGAGTIGIAIISAPTPVPCNSGDELGVIGTLGCTALGLWLLVGAWTGRSIPARLRGLLDWFLSDERDPTSKAAPTANAPDSTPKRPA